MFIFDTNQTQINKVSGGLFQNVVVFIEKFENTFTRSMRFLSDDGIPIHSKKYKVMYNNFLQDILAYDMHMISEKMKKVLVIVRSYITLEFYCR